MEQLAFIYKDSLFSVAILVFIIGSVILMDYLRSALAHRRNLKTLNALSRSYSQVELAYEVQQLLAKEQENALEVLGFKTWMFLAKHYAKYGSSEQAIKIYLALLPKYQNDRIAILESLAKAYIDMGYVQKARDILIEVLRIDPGNTRALHAMVQAHEIMCEPQKALQVLECLDELGTSGLADTYYYLQMQILIEQDLGLEDKSFAILTLGHQQPKLYKLALRHCKNHHKPLFLQEITNIEGQIDIYKYTQKKQKVANINAIYQRYTLTQKTPTRFEIAIQAIPPYFNVNNCRVVIRKQLIDTFTHSKEVMINLDFKRELRNKAVFDLFLECPK
ncbi:hypothetical protein NHP20013_08340 [Helicobacter bizzozeronii]|nr:hypothetical protein NHP20013_08340 [Helicobacter bizzozeronii]